MPRNPSGRDGNVRSPSGSNDGVASGVPNVPLPRHVRVEIAGAGFSGLCMAIALKARGIEDFAVLERGPDVGGTWRVNTYPGCQCDVPSYLYSFSFAPKPDWSRLYSMQGEILQYLRDCADRHGVRPRIHFDCEVLSARWNEREAQWHVATSSGLLTADVLVAATGALSEPSLPSIPGMETFHGRSFHSAAWPDRCELSGERVAVIGTGASAIQFVPKIQPVVSCLSVFQRTPPWILPQWDSEIPGSLIELFGRFPWIQKALRDGLYWGLEGGVLLAHLPVAKAMTWVARAHLRRETPNPVLRAKVIPRYTLGCKRVLVSNTWYSTLAQPNVELVTDEIREIGERSVTSKDGTVREIDTLIFATGFRATDPPLSRNVTGRDGLLLEAAWRDGMTAYRGTTVPGFPNFFVLVGPNTRPVHTSLTIMIEAQVEYVLSCLRHMDVSELATIEVRDDALRAFNEEVQTKLAATVWSRGGCSSWYLDAQGRNTTLWPGFTWRFRRLARRFDVDAYRVRRRADRWAGAAHDARAREWSA